MDDYQNLTPYTIVVRVGNQELTLPPSGTVARIMVRQREVGKIMGIPIVETITRGIEGLPPPRQGVFLITSVSVAQAVRRTDVIAPDAGPTAIRRHGQVVAITQFQRFG